MSKRTSSGRLTFTRSGSPKRWTPRSKSRETSSSIVSAADVKAMHARGDAVALAEVRDRALDRACHSSGRERTRWYKLWLLASGVGIDAGQRSASVALTAHAERPLAERVADARLALSGETAPDVKQRAAEVSRVLKGETADQDVKRRAADLMRTLRGER